MTATTANPFPGLRPFRTDEKHLFFGRDEQKGELVRRLRRNRFLAVVGTSGSGKSSLVRAGLLPELHGGFLIQAGSLWDVAVMRPGGDPLTHLAEALVDADVYDRDQEDVIQHVRATLTRSGLGLREAVRQSDLEPDGNLLIVADQFEELFRFRSAGDTQDEEASHFVKLLLEAAASPSDRIYIVITMRSDYIGDCSRFPGLAEAVNNGEYLIPQMRRDQYKAAIEGPVRVGGGNISRRLLHRLLSDLGNDADQLPILQHALMRAWESARQVSTAGTPAASPPSLTLDLADYEAIGTMREALSRHADELYEGLPDDAHRAVAERAFKALTEKGADNRGIRSPVSFERLQAVTDDPETELATVINAYRQSGCTFLMPPPSVDLQSATVIDLSHESLMRVWRRLRVWVEEESQSARIYRRLAESAELHAEGKAGFYHDPDLQIAWAWWKAKQPTTAWAERYHPGLRQAVAFLQESHKAQAAEELAREAARQRELEQARDLAASKASAATAFRRLAWSLLAGLLLSLALTGWAVHLQQRARVEEKRARTARNEAEKASEASFQLALEQQVLKAQQMFVSDQGAEGMSILAGVLRQDPTQNLAAKRLVTALIQRPFARPLWPTRMNAIDGDVADVIVTPDGQAVVYFDRGIRILNIRTGEVINDRFPRITRDAQVAISPDGEQLAVVQKTDTVSVWDFDSGELLWELTSPGLQFFKAQYSPDGDWIAAASGDKIVVWDRKNPAGPDRILRHPAAVRSFLFSPDGDRLAIVAMGWRLGQLHLWDLRSEAPPLRIESAGVFEGSPEEHRRVDFDPPGARVVSANFANARIWDAKTGRPLTPIMAHRYPIRTVAFSPDGRWVVTASNDRRAQIWNSKTGLPAGSPMLHRDGLTDAVFSPDGRRVATCSRDGTARIWSVPDGTAVSEPIPLAGRPWWIGFLGGGDFLAVKVSGRLETWDLRSADYLKVILPENLGRFSYSHMVFSPDGRWAATGVTAITGYNWRSTGPTSEDMHVQVWDTHTGQPAGPMLAHTDAIMDIRFHASHGLLFTATRSLGTVWEIPSMRRLWSAPIQQNLFSFHPTERSWLFVDAETTEPKRIQFFNADAGRITGKLEGVDNPAFATYSGDGTRVLVDAGSEGGFQWRDARSGSLQRPALEHGRNLSNHWMSRDRTRLAAVSNGLAGVWDLDSGRLVADEIPAPNGPAALSPNGDLLLTYPRPDSAQLWEVASGQPSVAPFQHRWILPWTDFSPDSEMVLTGSWDDTARLWDTKTGMPLTDPIRFPDWIHHVRFDPSGRRMAMVCRLTGTYLLELPQIELPAPEWMADLGEAVASRRMDHSNLTRPLDPQRWFQTKARLRAIAGDGPNERFLEWYLADPEDRTISPHSALSVSEWKRQMLASESSGSLQALVEREPLHAVAMARLARQNLPGRWDLQEADADLYSSEAVRLRPDLPEAWWTRAMILARAGDHTGAENAWREAVTRRGDDVNGWLARAYVLMQQNQSDAAYEAFKNAFARLRQSRDTESNQSEYLVPLFQHLVRAYAAQGNDWLAAADHFLDRFPRITVFDFVRDFLPLALWESDATNPDAWRIVSKSLARIPSTGGNRIQSSPGSMTAPDGGSARLFVKVQSPEDVLFQWFKDGDPIGGATEPTLTLDPVTDAAVGSYSVAVGYRTEGMPVLERSGDAHLALERDGVVYGAFFHEIYRNYPGDTLDAFGSNPRFPSDPDETLLLQSASWDCGVEKQVGTRTTGWVIPPQSGHYRFHLVADDAALLYVSRDDSRESLRLAAMARAWLQQDAWQKALRSPDIHLEGGKRYAIEILVKQASGGGHFHLAWERRNEAGEAPVLEPIPGSQLAYPAIFHSRPPGAIPGFAEALKTMIGPIPDRASECTPNQLDLSRQYNASLFDAWHMSQFNRFFHDLSALPTGLKAFGDIDFDVRGIVQLKGVNLEQNRPNAFPEAVHNIQVNRQVRRLHALHATGWGIGELMGHQIASFIWHYDDGTTAASPIVLGEHVLDWVGDRSEETAPEVVWSHSMRLEQPNRVYRLFKTPYDNPHPDKKVLRLDYTSAGTVAAPFLIALTTD